MQNAILVKTYENVTQGNTEIVISLPILLDLQGKYTSFTVQQIKPFLSDIVFNPEEGRVPPAAEIVGKDLEGFDKPTFETFEQVSLSGLRIFPVSFIYKFHPMKHGLELVRIEKSSWENMPQQETAIEKDQLSKVSKYYTSFVVPNRIGSGFLALEASQSILDSCCIMSCVRIYFTFYFLCTCVSFECPEKCPTSGVYQWIEAPYYIVGLIDCDKFSEMVRNAISPPDNGGSEKA